MRSSGHYREKSHTRGGYRAGAGRPLTGATVDEEAPSDEELLPACVCSLEGSFHIAAGDQAAHVKWLRLVEVANACGLLPTISRVQDDGTLKRVVNHRRVTEPVLLRALAAHGATGVLVAEFAEELYRRSDWGPHDQLTAEGKVATWMSRLRAKKIVTRTYDSDTGKTRYCLTRNFPKGS